jgi:hypothetical protein
VVGDHSPGRESRWYTNTAGAFETNSENFFQLRLCCPDFMPLKKKNKVER